MKYSKTILYSVIGLLVVFNLSVIFIFNADRQGISYFTTIDPVTGKEITIKNCEQLHAFELVVRDCVGWEK